MRTTVAALAMLLTFAVNDAAPARAQSGPAGHWEGAIQLPGQELQIALDLADRGGGKWEGTIDIPMQNIKGFPLGGLTVQGNTVSFAMKGVPGEPQFKGTLAADGKTIAGDFTQGGGGTTFSVARKGEAKFAVAAKSTPLTKEFEGSWEGSLDAEGTVLRLLVKLASQDGVGSGVMVSLDQGNAEIPITTVTQKDTHINLVLSLIAGSYDGDLKDGQIVGTWTQGPRSFPLTLKRAAK
jgi:hypothetical protein